MFQRAHILYLQKKKQVEIRRTFVKSVLPPVLLYINRVFKFVQKKKLIVITTTNLY